MLQRYAFLLVILGILATPILSLAQTTITAEVIYPTTGIYVLPSDNAHRIGTLIEGEIVNVWQRETAYMGEWVRVTSQQSGLTGWVDGAYLYFSDAQWKRAIPALNEWDLKNPLFVENDTLPPPFIEETSWCYNGPIQLRTDPWEAAEPDLVLNGDELVEILALATMNGSLSEFIRVRHLETAIEGWARAACIGDDFGDDELGWYNVNLPVMTFNTIISGTVSELTSITNRPAYLRFYPQRRASPNWGYIPRGTSLQIIGRNSCQYNHWCWFQTSYQGHVGWVGLFSLDFEDDYLQLPITLP